MAEKVLVMLINLSWQFALIFILSWLILAVFRVRSASARHVIWLAVVLCPLVLVPMNIVSSDIILFRIGNFERGATADHRFDLAGSNRDENSFPMITSIEEESLDKPVPFQPEIRAFPHHRSPKDTRAKLTLLPIFVWSLGVGVGIALIFAGHLRLRKLISRAQKVRDGKVFGVFHQVREEIKISRRVRLFASSEARTPFSIGFIRPCVILPDRMLGSDEKLRMVLIHETAHLKRFDDLVNLICRAIGSFMFFHPLFHLAVRELRLSSEQVCDGSVIRLTGTRADYADCLVEFSRVCAGRLPIGFAETGSSVTRRIKSIFKDEEVFKMMGRKGMMFLSASISLLIVMISATRLVGCASTAQSEVQPVQMQEKQTHEPLMEITCEDNAPMTPVPDQTDRTSLMRKQLAEYKMRLYEAEETLVEFQEESGVLDCLVSDNRLISEVTRFRNNLVAAELDLQEANIELQRAERQDTAKQAQKWKDRIRMLEARMMALRERIVEYDQKLQELPRRQMHFARFQREKDATESLYLALLQRMNEIEWKSLVKALRSRQDKTTDMSDLIRKKLGEYKVRLYEAEETLVEFQEESGVLDCLVSDKSLISDVAELRDDLVAKELDLQEVNIKLQLAEEQNSAEQAQKCRDRIRTLEARMMALRERIVEYDRKLQELPRRQMQLARFQRENDVAEDAYLMLLQKLNESRFPGKRQEDMTPVRF